MYLSLLLLLVLQLFIIVILYVYVETISSSYPAQGRNDLLSTKQTGTNEHFQLQKIKILTITSPNYEPVFTKFMQSLDLQRNTFLDLHVHHIDMSNFTSFGFQKESWYHAVHSKVKFVSEMLETLVEENEYIILTDSDIQYLQPSELIKLVRMAIERKLDYFGMAEGNGYNTGFYIVKNSTRTRAFFKHILHCLETEPYHDLGDQTIINREIPHSNLQHEKIPDKFCVNGPGSMVLRTSIMHHATSCGDIYCKLDQMQMIHDKYKQINI